MCAAASVRLPDARARRRSARFDGYDSEELVKAVVSGNQARLRRDLVAAVAQAPATRRRALVCAAGAARGRNLGGSDGAGRGGAHARRPRRSESLRCARAARGRRRACRGAQRLGEVVSEAYKNAHKASVAAMKERMRALAAQLGVPQMPQ